MIAREKDRGDQIFAKRIIDLCVNNMKFKGY